MNVFELLKGKKMKVMTDVKVEVELEIKKVEQIDHSQDLEPATSKNDWWPATREWTTYKVTFTNGSTKTYSSLHDIQIL